MLQTIRHFKKSGGRKRRPRSCQYRGGMGKVRNFPALVKGDKALSRG
jgi:hypothetical protein